MCNEAGMNALSKKREAKGMGKSVGERKYEGKKSHFNFTMNPVTHTSNSSQGEHSSSIIPNHTANSRGNKDYDAKNLKERNKGDKNLLMSLENTPMMKNAGSFSYRGFGKNDPFCNTTPEESSLSKENQGLPYWNHEDSIFMDFDMDQCTTRDKVE